MYIWHTGAKEDEIVNDTPTFLLACCVWMTPLAMGQRQSPPKDDNHTNNTNTNVIIM